jgi:hypothetical protein
MRALLLSLFVLLSGTAIAQPPSWLAGQLPQGELDLAAFTWFYEDTSSVPLPLPQIRAKAFRPFIHKRNERHTTADRSRTVTWLRFSIQNTHPTDTLRLYHETGVHNRSVAYRYDRVIAQTGRQNWGGLSRMSHPRRPFRQEYLLVIPPATRYTYYVQVVDYVLSLTPILSVVSAPQANLEKNYEEAVRLYPLLLVMSLLLGALLLMSLYALYSLLLTGDLAFLYYVLYTCLAMLITFHNLDGRFGFNWLYPHFTKLHPYFPSELHPALPSFFYGLFVVRMIPIRTRFPKGYRVVVGLLAILALQELLSLVEASRDQLLFAANSYYRYGLLPAGLLTLVLMGLVAKSHSPLRAYLVVGMGSLVCFTMLSVLFNFHILQLPAQLDEFVNLIPFWMLVGLSLEAFCFAMALAFRGRLVELENRQIQQHYARDLETQVARQAREIQRQSRDLEQQHLRQLEAAFDGKLASMEMRALRAQMNPHFIFNCLNSIKLYTLQHDVEQASEYLTKFSRLIRLVLENSRSESVTLKNELEALGLYLELEAMRFKQKVGFLIHVSAEVDVHYLKIPPLLLQPFVENAIWHGLMHKPEGGKVIIRVEQPTEHLLCVQITDDGVGRARAAQLKSKSADQHKSFGMQVTADRIGLINQFYHTHTQIQVLDLMDSYGQPCGTKVVLEIPVA